MSRRSRSCSRSSLPLAFAFAASLLLTSAARAEAQATSPSCNESCSVNRSCSSTGMACDPNDRACTGRAAAAGLEIRCEQRCDVRAQFVYCPPESGRGDSGYVWILLSLAMMLAVGGTTFAWLLLRKKA